MILANFEKFYQREVILLKLKIVSIVRILLLILMVFSTLFVALVPAVAFPASFDDGRYFPPFHMSMRGKVKNANHQNEVLYQIPFPSIPYDFSGDRYFSSTVQDNLSGYIVNYRSYGASEPETYFGPDSLPILDFRFTLDGSGPSGGVGFEPLLFSPVFEFMLEGGFLSSDYSLLNAKDGIVFAVFDPNTNVLLPGSVMAEFYVGSDPYQNYQSRIDETGAYLSYYEVLYRSDYPFMDHLPAGVDRVTWQSTFDSYSNVDFSNLTMDQADELNSLFSWVGPIFGSFGVDVVQDSFLSPVSFNVKYVLSDAIHSNNSVEVILEESAYSSYTGFERVTHFLGSAVGGFFSVEIFPSFSLGAILVVIIAFSLVLWWLKVFAGG